MNKKLLKTIGIILIPIMYIIFFLAIKYIRYLSFSYDLLFLATIGIIYVSLHFFLNIKKMYNWIFDFRYLIGAIIFAFLVIGGYHGSSIGCWNNYVDTNIKVENGEPIIGIARGIRSDEWLVSTMNNLSQANSSINFNKINNLMNAKDNDVSFYPRLIVKDLGILMHPSHIGYLFLPLENAFSFNWYFEIFAAFFVGIELFMLLTKKNKLYSTLGGFLLVISSAALWWNSHCCFLYGGLAILIINKFLNTKKVSMRVVLAALLGWVASCYVSIMYPAWMIPYAYLFVVLFIWILIENKSKLRWKHLLYLIITAAVCGALFLPFYFGASEVYDVIMNTVYPGKRTSYGGGDGRFFFTYMSNMFFPYIKIDNPCEYSQYLSLFPIPIIMSIYYLLKNKKQQKKVDWFLLMMTVFAIFLTIWCIFPLPAFISKITLLTMSTGYRAQLVVGYACIFIMIYLMSRYEKTESNKEKNIDKVLYLLFSLLISIIALWLSVTYINEAFPNIMTTLFNIISLIVFIPIFYLLIRNNKKTNFILFILLMFVTMISCILIMPISKGLSVIYEKPFAKEIQKLVKENSDAKFLTVDNSLILQNYILVNGGKSINSTNVVPNLELWHKLDEKKLYNDVYNRYAHVFVELTDSETVFELLQADAIKISLNYDDICITEANYLINTSALEYKPEYYSEIYHENNMYIYKTTCE